MVFESPSKKKPKRKSFTTKGVSFLLNNITFNVDFHFTNFGTTGSEKEEKGGITP